LERIEKQDLKTVEYGNLTAVLVEAIKEQQKQIEELKKRIEDLEAQ
jgi:cell division protein FtsB